MIVTLRARLKATTSHYFLGDQPLSVCASVTHSSTIACAPGSQHWPCARCVHLLDDRRRRQVASRDATSFPTTQGNPLRGVDIKLAWPDEATDTQ